MDFISNVWNKAASAIVPENGNSKESKAAANAQEATGAAQHENNAISEANRGTAEGDSGCGVTAGSIVTTTAAAAAVIAPEGAEAGMDSNTKDKVGDSRKASSATPAAGEAREDGVTSQVLHNVENVSHKAMEGAKSFGSFLFSVANKAGKTVTETATKVKTAVEENSILADFNHEQASFLASLTKNSAGALPWTGCENPEEMKQQILSLSEDKRTFVRNPPNGVQFEFDLEGQYAPVAMAMLKEDPRLEKMRFDLVPKLISEQDFWRNYFYRVSLVKQSSQLNSLAKSGGNGEGSTDTSTAEGPQTPSDDGKEDDGADSGIPSDFVSDSCEGKVNAEDLAKGMQQLGVRGGRSGKGDHELEQEIEKELDGYEVVQSGSTGAGVADDDDLENEIQNLLSATRK
ncbi:synapse-associated protein 1-like [Varroa jacobsoni]|uniref:BSD domain-containing protein n=1 Tax=Varroa destructor TaxID=109461 RepID=A0A7M7JG12_VARDE|nr:synapse-associated protein 1-like [Varroa destructor]XP_022651579.1 synapse-associated protein 1-like [Varroa destructor]XP_022651581.1 synapse-associated protein 1-like [Varroa destructor]XP_022697501.1 synapse-associated protein 1-like [Varroa jacobsoni]